MNVWTQVFLLIATVAQTGILIWGLKKISSVLESPVAPAVNGGVQMTFARSMLSEKTPPDGAASEPDTSFSRVAGSIGTVVLAALVGGVSYWVLYGLFNGNDLTKLKDIGPFLLAGTALFAPYAFNQLSTIFK